MEIQYRSRVARRSIVITISGVQLSIAEIILPAMIAEIWRNRNGQKGLKMKMFPIDKHLGVLFGIWIAVRGLRTYGRGKRGSRTEEFYQ